MTLQQCPQFDQVGTFLHKLGLNITSQRRTVGSLNVKSWLEDLLCAKMFFFNTWVSDSDKFTKNDIILQISNMSNNIAPQYYIGGHMID